jgi:hypothetical protein
MYIRENIFMRNTPEKVEHEVMTPATMGQLGAGSSTSAAGSRGHRRAKPVQPTYCRKNKMIVARLTVGGYMKNINGRHEIDQVRHDFLRN